jgi:hypothetical protein
VERGVRREEEEGGKREEIERERGEWREAKGNS